MNKGHWIYLTPRQEVPRVTCRSYLKPDVCAAVRLHIYQRLNMCFSLSPTSHCFGVELVHLPPFEEGHIEDGCIGIHELQEESLQNQTLLKVGLCFRDLCGHVNKIIWYLDRYVLDKLQTISKARILTRIIKWVAWKFLPTCFSSATSVQ